MIVDRAEITTYLGISDTVDTKTLGLLNMLHTPVERAVKGLLRSNVEQASYVHYLPKRETIPAQDAPLISPFDVQGNMAVAVYGRFVTGERLALPETPVRSVQSVFIDLMGWNNQAPGAYPAGGLLTLGQQYYLDIISGDSTSGLSYTGELVRIASAWPQVPESVKVSYTAGYSRAELDGDPSAAVDVSDIKLATMMAIVASYNTSMAAQKGAQAAIVRTRIGNYSVEYGGATPDATATDGFSVIVPRAARLMLQKYVNYQALIGT